MRDHIRFKTLLPPSGPEEAPMHPEFVSLTNGGDGEKR